MTKSTKDDRATWWLLGFGLIASTWFAYYPLPFLEFYKEWIFATALALAALSLRPPPIGFRSLRHPLAYGSMALLAALLLQAMLFDDLWPRATLMAGYVVFFLFALTAGRRLYEARRELSLIWLTGCLMVAALGSCFFAALQLNLIEFSFPLVASRSGNRISANLAQANHLADLLWLGCFGAAYLYVRGRLGLVPFVLVALLLLFFSQLTGSRMVWVYAGLAVVLGSVLRIWSRDPQVQRMSLVLVMLGGLMVLVTLVVLMSGVQQLFGISSGTERIMSAGGADSNRLRFWLWHAGIDAARHAPLLGVGVGRYVGHAHLLTMAVPDSPPAGADANAHNLFIHLAAELGIPVALIVALCLGLWLIAAVRRAAMDVDALAVLVLCGAILVHANLEYPLWYIYFLGLLGLLAGHLPPTVTAATSVVPDSRHKIGLHLAMPLAILGAAAVAYAQFSHLESAMQRVVMQVGIGAAPQRDQALESTLAELPRWSPYRDYAEAILLITALPTKSNASDLAARCDRAVVWGPSPYLLARCATAHQVAADPERASYFANSLCKMFPGSDLTLIQSMVYVERVSPEAGNIASSCVERLQ